MNQCLRYVKNLPSVKEVLEKIESNNIVEVSEANRDLSSLLSLCLKEDITNDIVIVSPNMYQAQKIYDELSNIVDDVYFYPKDDFVATELLTESFEFELQRVNTLKAIFFNKRKKIIVTSVMGLLNKVPKKEAYKNHIITIKENDTIKPRDLINNLINSGYKRVYTIEKQGEVSLRGSVLDVFPINENKPFRIDFFGDDVDSIKELDPETQRSKGLNKEITIMPVQEIIFSDEEKDIIKFYINDKLENSKLDKNSESKFRSDLEAIDELNNHSLLQKYVSLFIKENYSFIDYIDNKTVCFFDIKQIEAQEAVVYNEIYSYLSNFNDYLKPHDFLNTLSDYKESLEYQIYFNQEKTFYTDNIISLNNKDITNYESNYDLLLVDLKTALKGKTVLFSLSDRTYSILEDILKNHDIPYVSLEGNIKKGKINLYKGSFPSFEIVDDKFVSINEEKVFKNRKSYKTKYNLSVETKRLKSVSELKAGDYVVHYDYGIGQFLEITTMTLSNKTTDYIHIKYSEDEALYVPIENISLLSKYNGQEGYVPKLSKLNSKEWQKTKADARKKASDLAERLLSLYSNREEAEGFKYLDDDEIQEDFEREFDYDLTVDQERAIKEVKEDMVNGKLMDRLICGDVGFGKTEVAMRAAFKAVLSGKQVAVLAPTTILARQHYNTFKERMDKYGVEIALLSRFVSNKNIKTNIENTKDGRVDILIGTHRILSKDVNFKNLGLLIIDEEQKFGVEAKEKIKELKNNVDVLTLTATPIPRTLQMAITGIKNISLIETAPKNRYPVQTYVLERNDYIVKDAIERELSKGGQVFYLYNRVEDIELIYSYVKSLVPEASIAIIHGKMTREQIENTIDTFISKEIDVLVSTSIIESGIDIPNVNTLIVHDSDRYGLSQLYQLKGRVGRSDKISYAYLMYNGRKNLTEDAQKRLQAIKDFTELGSGFKIAVRDLTTRGAGEILGKEQSGFMNKVGVELYLKLLDEEIKKKKGEEIENTHDDFKIFISRHVEKDYISDDESLIEAHTKISKLRSTDELLQLKEEFRDRYGEVSDLLQEYMYAKLLENQLNKCKFERRDVSDKVCLFVIGPEETKTVDSESLFKYAQDISRNFNFYYKFRKLYIEYKNNSSLLSMYKDLSEYLEKCLNDALI